MFEVGEVETPSYQVTKFLDTFNFGVSEFHFSNKYAYLYETKQSIALVNIEEEG